MRRIRSTLTGSGFAILILAGMNLFVLLCVCLLLNNAQPPSFGVNVTPASTHFTIGSYDRSYSHIITVTPGTPPRFFSENTEIKGGMDGVDAVLGAWKDSAPMPSSVTVIIVCDEAVAIGVVYQLVDKVLTHGYRCAFFGRPDPSE